MCWETSYPLAVLMCYCVAGTKGVGGVSRRHWRHGCYGNHSHLHTIRLG